MGRRQAAVYDSGAVWWLSWYWADNQRQRRHPIHVTTPMHGRRSEHCKAKQTWYLVRSNKQKQNPSSYPRRGLSKPDFAQNEVEMTGRPNQGLRGNQRRTDDDAITCRSSRSLDEREQLSVFRVLEMGERGEELTARAAVAGGSASGAATVALHFDGWFVGGWWGGVGVEVLVWWSCS